MVNHRLLKLSSVSINLYMAMAYIPFQTSDIAFTLTVKGSPLHPCHWLYTTDLHIPFILAAWEAEFWDLAQEKLDYVTIHWKDSLRTATNRCFTMFHLNLCLEKNLGHGHISSLCFYRGLLITIPEGTPKWAKAISMTQALQLTQTPSHQATRTCQKWHPSCWNSKENHPQWFPVLVSTVHPKKASHMALKVYPESMWVCLKIVYPIFPMVLLIIIPIKWLFHWEY